MAYTIKKIADIAGVSVRTLHHYHQVGLVEPDDASPAGYRLYTETDLERLQRKEVREKYDPKIVAESEKRTGSYSKEDWQAVREEASEITERIASTMELGAADPKTQAAVGQFYKHINDRFYTCTPEIFRGLGEMYVQDQRFTAFYEKIKPGLAQFMLEAMRIYADSIA